MSPGALCAVGAAIVSITVAARAGAFTQFWDFLDFGAGVLSLVSLTSTVLWGLISTDRLLLKSGHRLLAQGVHRGLAVSGLGFLALHIWVKIAGQRTTASAAVVPFTDIGQPVLIGLGSLAGYLFVAVAVSGAVRSAFATKGRSLWWRALHFAAYPAWGASLVHGLKAGRAADLYVTVSYALCLLGVAGMLAFRIRSRTSESPTRPPGTASTQQLPVVAAVPRQRRESRARASGAREKFTGPAAPPTDDQPALTAVYAADPAGSSMDAGLGMGTAGMDGDQFATREWRL
ncbi:hypothetical protein AW27_004025 [Streptomyces sp. PCS3-D2]|uniref:hypothetical protein n=1 Tax=Streptomyces sp. PCS3-D2 TaxID=1460244 RepID=UPI0004452031|nr:hypothetical protein [Streptomyces sp. PCS3-D2]WKV70759.1 hypothetical protein AW27_004025 [Streptomyces sp. PCS3-D2]